MQYTFIWQPEETTLSLLLVQHVATSMDHSLPWEEKQEQWKIRAEQRYMQIWLLQANPQPIIVPTPTVLAAPSP